jgi:hypothetical protein
VVENKSIRLVCFVALCAFATATASEMRAAKPPQRASRMKLNDGGDRYSTDRSEPTDKALDSSAEPEETGSVTQIVSPQNVQEQDRLAQVFLSDRLAVWQERMKLEDWRISIVLTRRDDLKVRTLGGIRWDKTNKIAVMSVLDASDYRLPFQQMLGDMEFTLVHELVHLELASLPRSEASRSTEEHAVNQIAEAALLGLDRKR